jgi:hypothetical protein
MELDLFFPLLNSSMRLWELPELFDLGVKSGGDISWPGTLKVMLLREFFSSSNLFFID